jgi:glycosyltransferase involved in cell wall biosynthesis
MQVIKNILLIFHNSFLHKYLRILFIRFFSEKKYQKVKTYIKTRFLSSEKQYSIRKIGIQERKNIFGINVAGFITTGSGLGESTRNYLKAIESKEIPYVLNNYKGVSQYEQYKNSTTFTIDNPYTFNLLNFNPDQIDYFLIRARKQYLSGRYNIGVWYWEFPAIPDEWDRTFHYYDELWVVSDFMLSNIASYSPVPIVKIPMVIDLKHDELIDKPHFGIPESSFLFLFIFDFASIMERKNPLGAVHAFKKAFGNDPKVQLIIKITNSKLYKAKYALIKKTINNYHNINLFDVFLTRKRLNSLIRSADCYVSLHKAEGFGLGIAESMYYGKPVIVTAYSGNMDFTRFDNSYLVRYTLSEVDRDYGCIKKGNIWAEPDVDHAAELMRFVYENREEALRTGKIGQEFIRTHYNAHVVGNKLENRLKLNYYRLIQ